MKIKRQNIELAIIFGLVAAILCSFARFDNKCENLRKNIFRLHIIANSDDEIDQAVKLKIRDRIIEASSDLFQKDGTLQEAIVLADRNKALFTDIANDTLRENGLDYRAVVTVGKAHFDTRVYDAFTLPAGTYQALNIRLGRAEGKNWWCVLFPSVCVPAAGKHSLRESADNRSAEIAEHPNGYKIRFKSVEIYEKMRLFLKK